MNNNKEVGLYRQTINEQNLNIWPLGSGSRIQNHKKLIMNKINILLTGASGSVGYQVLKQLHEQKERFNISIFDTKTKKTVKKFKPFKNSLEITYGDIAQIDEVKKVCKGKDVVIHLAAIIPPLADENSKLAFKVNTLGTENLIKYLEILSPNCFFLYSSSISVYGDRLKDPKITVNDPLKPSEGDEYAKTKIAAEKIIEQSKLDWSIFRLSAIMGNHKISKLMFHQPLETIMEIATPEDTARAFVRAIDKKEKLSKQIFNLGGGGQCCIIYKDFLIRSFSIFGLGKPNFPPKTFAEKNFHCGIYTDGDKLEQILKFRTDTLESYFNKEKLKVSWWQKSLTYVFKTMIKKYLLKQSGPYLAYKTKDKAQLAHYFNSFTIN